MDRGGWLSSTFSGERERFGFQHWRKRASLQAGDGPVPRCPMFAVGP